MIISLFNSGVSKSFTNFPPIKMQQRISIFKSMQVHKMDFVPSLLPMVQSTLSSPSIVLNGLIKMESKISLSLVRKSPPKNNFISLSGWINDSNEEFLLGSTTQSIHQFQFPLIITEQSSIHLRVQIRDHFHSLTFFNLSSLTLFPISDTFDRFNYSNLNISYIINQRDSQGKKIFWSNQISSCWFRSISSGITRIFDRFACESFDFFGRWSEISIKYSFTIDIFNEFFNKKNFGNHHSFFHILQISPVDLSIEQISTIISIISFNQIENLLWKCTISRQSHPSIRWEYHHSNKFLRFHFIGFFSECYHSITWSNESSSNGFVSSETNGENENDEKKIQWFSSF